MYDKEYYRAEFNKLKKYLKLSHFATDCGIAYSNLSWFMKNNAYDHYMSIDKCDILLNYIKNYFNQI